MAVMFTLRHTLYDRQHIEAYVMCFFNKSVALVSGLLAMSLCALVAQASDNVTIVTRNDNNARHAINVIKLGLAKADYDYRLNIIEGDYSEDRLEKSLTDGDIDISWMATNQKNEDAFLPVRIPIFKGLLGWRVFIVHQDNQHIFDSVNNLADLQRFTLGQGRTWTDTQILRANNLKVETGNYDGLFMMTDGKRFDAFPRGIHEPWAEIAQRRDLKLTIDENLIVAYKMPYYLFVSPKKPQLANALRRGLRMAIDDGSFDAMFLNDAFIKKTLAEANVKKRRVIELKNPDLPAKTPLDDASLWLNLNSL
jgi:hypothetical protein